MVTFSLMIACFLLCTVTTTLAFTCTKNVCENGGSCIASKDSERCVCTKRYYGILCDKYSSSYTIFLQPNQQQVLPDLSNLLINNGLSHANLTLDATNTGLDVIFYVDNLEMNALKAVLASNFDINAAVISVRDFDECSTTDYAVQCRLEKECVNTIGSFYCSCGEGFKEEEGECIDNSLWVRAETQIWLIVIGTALVVLIVMITIVYRKRYMIKKRKRKFRRKEQVEQRKKSYVKRNNTLSSGSSKPLDGSLPPRSSTQSDVFDEVDAMLGYPADPYGSNVYDGSNYGYRDNRDMYGGDNEAFEQNAYPKHGREVLEYDQSQMKYYLNRGYSIDESKKLTSLTSKYGTRHLEHLPNKTKYSSSLPSTKGKSTYPSKTVPRRGYPPTPKAYRSKQNQDPSISSRLSSWDPFEPAWNTSNRRSTRANTISNPYNGSIPQIDYPNIHSVMQNIPIVYDDLYVTDHVSDLAYDYEPTGADVYNSYSYGNDILWDNPMSPQNNIYNVYS